CRSSPNGNAKLALRSVWYTNEPEHQPILLSPRRRRDHRPDLALLCRADAGIHSGAADATASAKVDDRQCQDTDRGRVGHRARMRLWICAVACDRHPYRRCDDLLTHRKPNVLSAAGGKPVDSE